MVWLEKLSPHGEQGYGGAPPESDDGVMTGESSRLTSDLLWRGTAVAFLIDVPLLGCLAVAAFLVYAALWGGVAATYFWDSVYRAVFPEWSRWLLPPGFGVLYGLLAVLLWRLSIRAERWQAVWFAVLGGLVSLPGHAIGIARGLLRVPLLSEASATSALVFGVFEFIFYWCVIVVLAATGRGAVTRVGGCHA